VGTVLPYAKLEKKVREGMLLSTAGKTQDLTDKPGACGSHL
jgi:hypothetical protein